MSTYELNDDDVEAWCSGSADAAHRIHDDLRAQVFGQKKAFRQEEDGED
mgnify:CR=1 FL=1